MPGSVGVPTGTEIAIVSPDGQLLAAGEAGEVVIRGPGVMTGYLSNPAATADAFVDGWFRTGDRGVIRDGYLYLEGRLKEMILRGGENISPARDRAGAALPPGRRRRGLLRGRRRQVRRGARGSGDAQPGCEPSELIGHCRERLAAFKVPVTVYVLPEIPRTPTGKVQRRRVGESIVGSKAAG